MALLISIALACAAQATLPPDTRGPSIVSTAERYRFAIPSGEIDGDLYWPQSAPAPAPIIVVGHGYARSSGAVTGWGAHFASHGFVVAVPDFPNPFQPNHEANAVRMLELIALLRTAPQPIDVPIDPRAAVVGHSAGGLSALLAAAIDNTLVAAVGLDPVDSEMMIGAAAGPQISAPVLVLGGAPAQCNAQGSGSALFAAVSSHHSWYLRITGASHCDAEDPSNATCNVFCGVDDPARRTLFRRYATAHLLAHFRCRGLEWLPGGAGLDGDLNAGTAGELAQILSPTALCITPPPPDAGVEEDAGLAEDAGLPDAEVFPDAQTTEPDARAPAADSGEPIDAGTTMPLPPAETRIAPDELVEVESCGCTTTRTREPWLALLLLIALTRFSRSADSTSSSRRPGLQNRTRSMHK